MAIVPRMVAVVEVQVADMATEEVAEQLAGIMVVEAVENPHWEQGLDMQEQTAL